MDQDWARCQRMMQHEQLRYEELKNLTSQVNVQPVRADFLYVQTGATNPNPTSSFRAIELVNRELYFRQSSEQT